MWFRLVVVALLATCACHDPDVDTLASIKDKVCACHTGDCADKAVKLVGDHPIESNRRTQKLAKAMLACVAKAHEDELSDEPSGSATP